MEACSERFEFSNELVNSKQPVTLFHHDEPKGPAAVTGIIAITLSLPKDKMWTFADRSPFSWTCFLQILGEPIGWPKDILNIRKTSRDLPSGWTTATAQGKAMQALSAKTDAVGSPPKCWNETIDEINLNLNKLRGWMELFSEGHPFNHATFQYL